VDVDGNCWSRMPPKAVTPSCWIVAGGCWRLLEAAGLDVKRRLAKCTCELPVGWLEVRYLLRGWLQQRRPITLGSMHIGKAMYACM
jgi:hypothetical protein